MLPLPRLTRLMMATGLLIALLIPASASAFQKGFPMVESTGTIYRVIDADTFVVNMDDRNAYQAMTTYANGDADRLRYLNDRFSSIRVRLANVDTPESVHRDTSLNTDEGRQLSATAKRMLEGQRTRVSCYDWGSWGRAICTVAKPSGRDFGEWLIANGHSPYITSWGRNPLYHDRYQQAAGQ